MCSNGELPINIFKDLLSRNANYFEQLFFDGMDGVLNKYFWMDNNPELSKYSSFSIYKWIFMTHWTTNVEKYLGCNQGPLELIKIFLKNILNHNHELLKNIFRNLKTNLIISIRVSQSKRRTGDGVLNKYFEWTTQKPWKF